MFWHHPVLWGILSKLVAGSTRPHSVHDIGLQDEVNVSEYEMDALNDLYVSTGGGNWLYSGNGTEWAFSNTSNPCADEWAGITCVLPYPYDQYHISELSLPHYNLKGHLPSSLGNLTYLTVLSLPNNALNGSIPPTIVHLSNLTTLNMEFNTLTGPVSDTIGNLTQLEVVLLGQNKLTGTISTTFATIASLSQLDLANNQLHGTMPPQLGDLYLLERLLLHDNPLSGTIPGSFGQLRNLQFLMLSSNHLHGSIPSSLTALTKLSYLNLADNRLTGPLPESIGNMSSLAMLLLPNNVLTNTLPQSLTQLASLQMLILGSNRFNGTIPDFLSDIPLLTHLGLYENHFTGTIPAALGSAENLVELNLGLNKLYGTISAELSQLSQLQYLGVTNTKIEGTLPPELGNLRNLRSLVLGNNNFYGSIPESFQGLTSLQQIGLTNNSLSGSLPPSLGSLKSLEYLTVSNNRLTGTIPSTYAQLSSLVSLQVQNNLLTGPLDQVFDPAVQTKLQSVQVSSNQLTGSIPAAVFTIPTLISFISVSNCFHGELPTTLCEAAALQTLDLDALRTATQCRKKLLPGLSDTYIMVDAVNGAVPACLFGLPSLTTLHLSSNAFTSSLPSDLVVSSQLQDLSLSYNKLTGPIPRSIQTRPWTTLHLNDNRFSGTLASDFAPYAADESVKLHYNRLSGEVPPALVHAADVSVLESNIFSCDVDRSDLPQNDPYFDLYQCGSDATNTPYFVWLGCSCVLVALVCLALWREKVVTLLSSAMASANEWLSVSQQNDGASFVPSLVHITAVFRALSLTGAVCAAFAVLVLAPAYAVLTVYCGTHTYEYIWTVSAVLLAGDIALGVVMVLLTMLICVFMLAYRYFTRHLKQATALASGQDSQISVDGSGDKYGQWLNVFLYLTINFGVVGVVNAYYVFLKLNSTSAYQFFISAFKIVWSSLCAPYLSRRLLHPRPAFATLELVVSLCNTIVIPIICVIFVSPDCFYHVFVMQSDLSVTNISTECVAQGPSGCVVASQTVETLEFPPPYLYTFQCSYVFAEFYVPAFIYVCLIASFGVPLIEMLLVWLHSHTQDGSALHTGIDRILPRVLKKIKSDAVSTEQRDRLRPFFDAPQFVVAQLTYLCLLMTFGAVFPPLAASLALTMVCTTTSARLKVGRLLTAARDANLSGYEEVVEAECAGVAQAPMLQRSMWVIVHLSAAFYALSLFDTNGIEAGFQRAYWLLIVVSLLPATIYCAYSGAQLCTAGISEERIGAAHYFELDDSSLDRKSQENLKELSAPLILAGSENATSSALHMQA